MAAGDGDDCGANSINRLTWNRGGVGNSAACGYNHFAGYLTSTTASRAHSGVLGTNMTHGTDVGGIGG